MYARHKDDPETGELPAVDADPAASNIIEGWSGMQEWLDKMTPDNEENAAA